MPEPREVPTLDDLRVRLIGIPAFGVVIPNVTGLFGELGPRDPAYWIGYLWFVGLAWLIWHGNRWLLFQQRRWLDWFRHPAQKVLLLLFAIVCYTAPLTTLWLLGWYGWSGIEQPNLVAIQTTALINVICVVFVTHVYETVFLIRERSEDFIRLERLEHARAQAQLDALRNQIDPHFLFNSLNTLGWLIETDPPRAGAFNETLARVYRYLLAHRDRDLVPLREELGFVDDYAFLLQLRFGEALRVEFHGRERWADVRLVVPVSVQLLIENAVKHNVFSSHDPLTIHVRMDSAHVEVKNPRRPKSIRESSRVGLQNLAARYRLVVGTDIDVDQDETRFLVRLPTVEAA